MRLRIGTKKHNLGYLRLKIHRSFREPKSLYIKKRHNTYWVSFCYEEASKEPMPTEKQQFQSLSKKSQAYLERHVIGVDRGVARPVQSSLKEDAFWDLSASEKRKKDYVEKRRLHYQKKLSRQEKGSKRRYKTKIQLSNRHAKIAHIRDNFCHQVSRKLVDQKEAQVIIFEDLGTKRMTKKPKAKKDQNGKYLPNRARAKAGLSKSILDKNWHTLEVYTKYKALQSGKSFFKVSPHHTSQECANCHHIHPQNRKSQSRFKCQACGHTDNADFNASKVIKWRAIQCFLNSGTELSKRGVLSLGGIGRGANIRRKKVTRPTGAVA